jgi:hypothetical protein
MLSSPCLALPLHRNAFLAAIVVRAQGSGSGSSDYDYDFFVIGSGSGGTRASRIATSFGAKTNPRADRVTFLL